MGNILLLSTISDHAQLRILLIDHLQLIKNKQRKISHIDFVLIWTNLKISSPSRILIPIVSTVFLSLSRSSNVAQIESSILLRSYKIIDLAFNKR